MLGAALVGAGGLGLLVGAPGTDPFLEGPGPAAGEVVLPLNAPNPSQAGPYQVASLCYGSGTDRHRPEYGRDVESEDRFRRYLGVRQVRQGPALSWWAGRRYWGFEPNSFPLNARVWFPQDEGLFPLVLIVHGNHEMTQFSDPGYAYLGELLASRGFIVASIDENFLNHSWSSSRHNEERGPEAGCS